MKLVAVILFALSTALSSDSLADSSKCTEPTTVICTVNEVEQLAHNDDLTAVDTLYSLERFDSAVESLVYFSSDDTPMINIAIAHANKLAGVDISSEYDSLMSQFHQIVERANTQTLLRGARERFWASKMMGEMFPENQDLSGLLDYHLTLYRNAYTETKANGSLWEIVLFNSLSKPSAPSSQLYPEIDDPDIILFTPPHLPLFYARVRYTTEARPDILATLTPKEHDWVEEGFHEQQPATIAYKLLHLYYSNRYDFQRGKIDDELAQLLDLGEELGFTRALLIKLGSPAYSEDHCRLLSAIDARGIASEDYDLYIRAIAQRQQLNRQNRCNPAN